MGEMMGRRSQIHAVVPPIQKHVAAPIRHRDRPPFGNRAADLNRMGEGKHPHPQGQSIPRGVDQPNVDPCIKPFGKAFDTFVLPCRGKVQWQP